MLAWLLLLGGLRASAYVASMVHTNIHSDPADLQELTGVHTNVWSLLFVFVALSALIAGARWLLGA